MSAELLDIEYGKYNRPCFGERVSGDSAIVLEDGNLVFIGVVDVLGHGQEAYHLACIITDYLKERWTEDVLETMQRLDLKIKGSRGAAVGLAVLNRASGNLSYTAVGNTCLRKVYANSLELYSVDGIVGIRMRQPTIQNLHLNKGDLLLAYTDGISDRFSLKDYPQMRYENVAAISRNVVRRFGKTYDDATCIAMRC